jgi:parvulin-like peptidyl-prolyl isomerase
LISCTLERSQPDPAEPTAQPAADEQAEPRDLAGPAYASQGDIVVTVDDLIRAISWREWITGQPISVAYGPEWFADESLIRRLTSNLFDEALVEQDCATWGIEVSEQELETAVRGNPEAQALLQSPRPERVRTLAQRGLTWADVERAARQTVLMQKWQQHRVDSLSEDDLRAAYFSRNNRARLEIAVVPNVHSRETIEDVITSRSNEIAQYYADHAGFFLLPRGARIREVAIEGAEDDPVARARVEALLATALEDGFDAIIGDEGSTQPISRGNVDTWIPQAQFPAAFDALPGEVSGPARFRGHWVVFELLEHRGREMRPLDDDVRQQIAHHLARETSVAEEAMADAQRLAAALRENSDNAATIYVGHRVLSETTSDFRRSPTGIVPSLGEAAALSDLVFADGVEVGDVLGPAHVAAGVAVARVLSRTTADEAQFQENLEAFTAEFSQYMREHAWPARVAEFASQHERDVDGGAASAALAQGVTAAE